MKKTGGRKFHWTVPLKSLFMNKVGQILLGSILLTLNLCKSSSYQWFYGICYNSLLTVFYIILINIFFFIFFLNYFPVSLMLQLFFAISVFTYFIPTIPLLLFQYLLSYIVFWNSFSGRHPFFVIFYSETHPLTFSFDIILFHSIMKLFLCFSHLIYFVCHSFLKHFLYFSFIWHFLLKLFLGHSPLILLLCVMSFCSETLPLPFSYCKILF